VDAIRECGFFRAMLQNVCLDMASMAAHYLPVLSRLRRLSTSLFHGFRGYINNCRKMHAILYPLCSVVDQISCVGIPCEN
jgi:hypothetical protein